MSMGLRVLRLDSRSRVGQEETGLLALSASRHTRLRGHQTFPRSIRSVTQQL